MKIVCKCLLVLCALVSLSTLAYTDKDLLPAGQYDSAISTPSTVLGEPVATWHVRHDQLVQYMRLLAEQSDRISLIETGRTHENRPLMLLAITSPENQSQLDTIQQRHNATIASGKAAKESDPLVIWMGYSVHGDEASGSNAAMLVAYYLAAAQSEQVQELLQNSVVLLDPSLNPDGLSRFAQWANMHRGQNLVADGDHREHVQGWPSARTNHYWFDLNRDWLLLTHPESQARIKQFHQWRPHVLTDFHEMGADSTYFFQPGIASRKNPLTPAKNVELTEALANFHAKALDADKELYFTEESFDDFYYGKGSTYPDAHGSVGILFEQGTSRGHLQHTPFGLRHFSDAVRNQVTTSLSTFAGAMAHKQDLQKFQESFYEETRDLIKNDEVRGFILSEQHDQTRFKQLQNILKQHQIRINYLTKPVKVDDKQYQPQSSIYVSLDQPQYRLIKSLFSTRKRFNDNTFYDVSSWNLALAFNVDYQPVKRSAWRKLPLTEQPIAAGSVSNQGLQGNAYAYAFSWQDYHAPRLLQRLLQADVQVQIAGSAFSATTSQGKISFAPGSVVIPMGMKQPTGLTALLQENADELNIKVWSVTSGLTSEGIDLGSGKMHRLKAPKVMIIGGRQTSEYEVGEAWHYLDTRVDMPVSIIELDRLQYPKVGFGRGKPVDLANYTHIIMVNGEYQHVSEAFIEKLKDWVNAGGVLIGQTSANRWLSEQKLLAAEFMSSKEVKDLFETDSLKYADKEGLEARQRIAGATYETLLDLSHPLAFGFTRESLPTFRNHTAVMLMPAKPFITVGKYADTPLMAGYSSDEMQKVLGNTASIVAHKQGQGKVIAIADNPNFRGYWYGASRLLSNAIFMSAFINGQG